MDDTKELKPVAWQRRLSGPRVLATGKDWHVISDEQRKQLEKDGHPHGLPDVTAEIRPLYTADALERLERERDFEQSSRLTSEAQLGTLISNLEAELTALRARLAKMEEAAWFVRDHLAYTLAGPFGTAGEARAIAKIDAALTEEQP